MDVLSWRDRAREKIRELGLTDIEVSRRMGSSPSNFSLWMSGQRHPKMNNMKAIAEVLGVSLHWLETGEELPDPKSLPYMSLEEVRAFLHELEEKCDAIQRHSGVIIIETGQDSFLLKIDNDTMAHPSSSDLTPGIPKDSEVQVDRDVEPVPGKILLIEYEGELSLRLWTPISPTKHSLRFINRLYANFDISYQGDIQDIYRGTAVGVRYRL
ncbi:helix-turn-helix domain-containing protein [Endozoicomonas sp.]|uniref:helix-turn-helix domain-containing protein n=1 Tax=Endozoicomonas sp. TaxID=1892382 RepID=UPI003AF45FBD